MKPSLLFAFVAGALFAFAMNVRPSNAGEHPVPESPLWLTYSGETGPGVGKHIVLIAADQEYRSEYSMPMLARLLAKHHGFHCTVLFSLNKDNEVDPTQKIRWEDKSITHNIPGLEHLEKCDFVILFSRLLSLPPEQLQHIYNYLDSGKPIIGIRTANHGFIEFDYKKDGHLPEGCLPLVNGQPLLGRNHDDAINPELIPLPVAWVKTWTGNTAHTARVFNLTMGSAQDFKSEGVRRMTVNAVYWCQHMESHIDAQSCMDIVGEYTPPDSGFAYRELNIVPRKPSFYR